MSGSPNEVAADPSRPAWAADIDVDAPLAARLIAAAFPTLAGASVEAFGVGWDNAAFLVDRRIVFRFPRRLIATALLEREVAILPYLADRLPLAISTPSYLGTPSPAFPWTFAGYDLIDGVTACSTDLSDDARRALAEPLALFLRALHALEPEPLIARGLPPDQLGRLDPSKRLAMTRERLPALVAAGLVTNPDRVMAWLGAHPPEPLADVDRRVLHGDLYARHVVLGRTGELAGIIDWGDVHLGDPALDLSVAHMLLPHDAHPIFRRAYGPIDERSWDAARYRAIYHAILELDYGHREHDAGMLRSGADVLRRVGAELWPRSG